MAATFMVIAGACAFMPTVWASMGSDIISDLTGSSADESRALGIKTEQFWQPLLHAAGEASQESHLALYQEVESALQSLPAENTFVKEALAESLTRLQRADARLLAQAAMSSEVASEKLAEPAGWESSFSFFTGGQSFLAQAVKRFVSGEYGEQLDAQVRKRQMDVLPVLKEAASATSDVLGECRKATTLAFDILKYDIYNKGVPKTPTEVKTLANRLVEASGETRRRFSQLIRGTAAGLVKDAEGKREAPSATVTRAVFAGLDQPESIIRTSIPRIVPGKLVNI